MKYKVVGLILVLLMATPVFGQKISPVITVDFPRATVPTTVITGQPFVQTLRIRFIDLAHKGQEVIVREEDFTSLKTWGKFDVLSVSIDKQIVPRNFLEHVWYVKFTLAIINEKKGQEKLPPLAVVWAIKKMGQDSKDPGLVWNGDVKTMEIPVNYVTTVTKDPHLDIRDGIELGSFSGRVWIFNILAWSFAVIPPLVWLFMLFRYFRKPVEVSKEVDVSGVGQNIPVGVSLTRKTALKQIRKRARVLHHVAEGKIVGNASEMMPELNHALMNFLRTQVPGSSLGTTPEEMRDIVMAGYRNSVIGGSKQKVLLRMADRAVFYENATEEGEVGLDWPVNPMDDYKSLRKDLSYFAWYMGPINFVRDFPSRFKNIFFRKTRKG